MYSHVLTNIFIWKKMAHDFGWYLSVLIKLKPLLGQKTTELMKF